MSNKLKCTKCQADFESNFADKKYCEKCSLRFIIEKLTKELQDKKDIFKGRYNETA